MRGSLLRGVHLHAHLLLHLRELEVVCRIGREGLLILDRRVALHVAHALHALGDHAHVHILLVCGGNLLLLLLEHFDLLLKSKLFHHERGQFGGTATVRNVQLAACRTRNTRRVLLSHGDCGCRVIPALDGGRPNMEE